MRQFGNPDLSNIDMHQLYLTHCLHIVHACVCVCARVHVCDVGGRQPPMFQQGKHTEVDK